MPPGVQRPTGWRPLWLAGLVLAAATASGVSHGQTAGEIDAQTEYNVKAAYLYSFGRYVTWPETSFPDVKSPFVIGVLGTDPFGAALDRIAATRQVEGRAVVIRRFRSLDEYVPSHVLFVSSQTPIETRTSLIQKTLPDHVLIVGESPGFALAGGVVNFVLEGANVRFEINHEAAKERQLLIDAKLLRLAKLVPAP